MATDTQIYTSKYTGKQIDNTLSTCFIKNLENTENATGVELSSNITNAVVVNNFESEGGKYKISKNGQKVISLDTYFPKIEIIPKTIGTNSGEGDIIWNTSTTELDKSLGTLFCDITGIPTNANILGIRITSNHSVSSSGLTADRDTWPEIICDNRIIKDTTTNTITLRIYSNLGITGKVKVTHMVGGGN